VSNKGGAKHQGVSGIMKTLACLIVDDPFLATKHYSHLYWNDLLAEMKAHRFFTEVGFIPFNFRRSTPQTIKLFRENPDYFSICVHGCDHTGAEFGGTDYRRLRDLAETSLWRMKEHKRLTGLPFDPIMVFPQGHYSPEAMRALKDTGYFAAFNTVGPEVIQSPATVIEGLPLFKRRYPHDRHFFIEDMNAGRPIIVVVHPKDFKDINKLIDTINWINSLGDIQWTSLLNIAECYLGKKAVPIGEVRPRVKTNIKAGLRRTLSELRDNNVVFEKLYNVVKG
jgi:hypothetical protein